MSRNLALASRFRRQARSKNEGGYLLLELALVLAISTILLTGQINQIVTAVDEGNSISTAKYLQVLQGAINEYHQDHEVALKTPGATVTGFANPLQPTVPELLAGGFLEPGFPIRSPLGLTFQNELVRSGTCPAGPDCRVSGFARSTGPYRDGEGQLRIDTLTAAVTYIGLDAGMSLPESPALLTSVGGATVTNPAGSVAGTLAIRVGHGSGSLPRLTQYYKLDGSRALAGAMNANSNDIKSVRNLEVIGTSTAQNLVVKGDAKIELNAAPGSACSATSDTAIRRNSSGTGLVICSGGSWQMVGNVIAGIADGEPCTAAGQLGSNTTGAGFVCNGAYWSSLNTTANAGDTCAPEGRVATAINNREQLVCTSGRFVKLSNVLSKTVEVKRWLVQDGMNVAKIGCDVGGTPTYSFHLLQTVVDVSVTPPRQVMLIRARDGGVYWTVEIKVKDNTGAEFSANSYSINAVMRLECTY
jgi:type II secretory pathway pseudopilin PulG